MNLLKKLFPRMLGQIVADFPTNVVSPKDRMIYLLQTHKEQTWWQLAASLGYGSERTKYLISNLVKQNIVKDVGVPDYMPPEKVNSFLREDITLYSLI